MVLMRESSAKAKGIKVLARILSYADAAQVIIINNRNHINDRANNDRNQICLQLHQPWPFQKPCRRQG